MQICNAAGFFWFFFVLLIRPQNKSKHTAIHRFQVYPLPGKAFFFFHIEHEFALFLGLGSPKSLSSAAQWLKEHIVCESLRMPRRNTLLDRL